VAPLKPVPVGVDSSLDVECCDERGILRNDRFFFGSSSVPSPPYVDFEVVRCRSSVEEGPLDDDLGGARGGLGLAVRLLEGAARSRD
jgi:hypothetical protein